MLSLRGLRATPVSSCQPAPGQELAAEHASGFGSRSLGGPAEPAGLPGEPVPRAEAGAPAQRELSKRQSLSIHCARAAPSS